MNKLVKYKEFINFINRRTCDYGWHLQSAMTCIEIRQDCEKQPFWKRSRYFKKNYSEVVIKFIERTENEIKSKRYNFPLFSYDKREVNCEH